MQVILENVFVLFQTQKNSLDNSGTHDFGNFNTSSSDCSDFDDDDDDNIERIDVGF